jgi:hypothetical protein
LECRAGAGDDRRESNPGVPHTNERPEKRGVVFHGDRAADRSDQQVIRCDAKRQLGRGLVCRGLKPVEVQTVPDHSDTAEGKCDFSRHAFGQP